MTSVIAKQVSVTRFRAPIIAPVGAVADRNSVTEAVLKTRALNIIITMNSQVTSIANVVATALL